MTEQELNPEIIKKLNEYQEKNCKFIEKTEQKVSEDGKEVTLIAQVTLPDINIIYDDITAFEKILDAKYESFITLQGTTQLKFRFNEK